MRNETGEVFFSGGRATGGDGGPALCDLFAGTCGAGGRGGDGYRQEFASASVVFRGGELSGGNGGFSGEGFPALSGRATDVEVGALSVVPAPPRGFDVTSPAREGETVTLTFGTQPGDVVLLLFGTSPTQVFVPAGQGALLVVPPNLVVIGPAVGSLFEFSGTVPDLPAGLDDATLFRQAAFTDGTRPLLGPSRALTLVVEAF